MHCWLLWLLLTYVVSGAEQEPDDIVGGVPARKEQFPFLVSLQHTCGGALIDPHWVLTAGHCRQRVGQFVDFNRNDLKTNEASGERHQIAAVFPHPKYNYNDFTTDLHDIQLLRLRTPAKYTEPARLVTHAEAPTYEEEGVVLTAAGWGATSKENVKRNIASPIMRTVNVPVKTNERCGDKNHYGNKNKPGSGLPRLIFPSNMCAGYEAGMRDSCVGDSGGPLFRKVKGEFIVVGINSWALGCALPKYYGVYSRVSSFSDWIKVTMSENNKITLQPTPMTHCTKTEDEYCVPESADTTKTNCCVMYLRCINGKCNLPSESPTTANPTRAPSTVSPTSAAPSTGAPTSQCPTRTPSAAPTASPTSKSPTLAPTKKPTARTLAPSEKPTTAPTGSPSYVPTTVPTSASPTGMPTGNTSSPTGAPTNYTVYYVDRVVQNNVEVEVALKVAGFPVWALALIIVGALGLCCCVCVVVIWKRKDRLLEKYGYGRKSQMQHFVARTSHFVKSGMDNVARKAANFRQSVVRGSVMERVSRVSKVTGVARHSCAIGLRSTRVNTGLQSRSKSPRNLNLGSMRNLTPTNLNTASSKKKGFLGLNSRSNGIASLRINGHPSASSRHSQSPIKGRISSPGGASSRNNFAGTPVKYGVAHSTGSHSHSPTGNPLTPHNRRSNSQNRWKPRSRRKRPSGQRPSQMFAERSRLSAQASASSERHKRTESGGSRVEAAVTKHVSFSTDDEDVRASSTATSMDIFVEAPAAQPGLNIFEKPAVRELGKLRARLPSFEE